MVKIPLPEIIINGRHRTDMGDLQSLADSMISVGLLHPVVLGPGNKLVAGSRRIEAAKLLGWTQIEARRVDSINDALKSLKAERDENTCRKEFSPSEAVEVGRAIEAIETPEAAERRRGTQGRPKNTSKIEPSNDKDLGSKKTGGNLPPVSGRPKKPRKTRQSVASAVGISERTYDKAKAVVEAAEKEPDKFAEVVAEMDRTGKVDPAFKKVKESTNPAPTVPVVEIKDEEGCVVPERCQDAFNGRPRFDAVLNSLTQISRLVKIMMGEEAGEVPAGAEYLRRQDVNSAAKQFRRSVKAGRPHSICPYCLGSGKRGDEDCDGCRALGWMNEDTLGRVPKQIISKMKGGAI